MPSNHMTKHLSLVKQLLPPAPHPSDPHPSLDPLHYENLPPLSGTFRSKTAPRRLSDQLTLFSKNIQATIPPSSYASPTGPSSTHHSMLVSASCSCLGNDQVHLFLTCFQMSGRQAPGIASMSSTSDLFKWTRIPG